MSNANNLAQAASAYLRAAQGQPVRWQQWGENAFALARQENKPVLLHIGATWCHWCRVMDRESFENAETAEVLNEHFVAIRVDRDERPDVDALYQSAVETISGQGGWPLTVFLTPEGLPFFGGGYFPPEDRYDRAGFPRVLLTMAGAFLGSRGDVEETASSVLASLEASESRTGRGDLKRALVDRLTAVCIAQFDEQNGGFGSQPKFPHIGALRLLQEVAADGGIDGSQAAHVVSATLLAMRAGGIHDQLGGGFYRFSTDERWIVPRFEKMACDNAELLRVYVNAFEQTGEPEFASAAQGIVRWMDGWLSDRERGGFYASQTADAALGDDGGYYTWTRAEARAVLSDEEFGVAALHFHLRDIGDMHSNPQKNVLRIRATVSQIARQLSLEESRAAALLEAAQRQLSAARLRRPAPAVDSTLYTSWNGLCISAYLHAARVLNLPEARTFALRSLERIIKIAWSDEHGLAHVAAYVGASAPLPARRVAGMLEDYAFLAAAALDAWEVTNERRFLEMAEGLVDDMLLRFHDREAGGFFDTAVHPGSLPALGLLRVKRKPIEDSLTPAGNAAAVSILLRLGKQTGNEEFRTAAAKTLRLFAEGAGELGLQGASYACALRMWVNGGGGFRKGE